MADKGLLIGEMASLFGVSIDTLRYYDKAGLLSPLRNSSTGYRYYGIHDISKLIAILFLRKIDVPMKVISNGLDEYDLNDTVALLKEKREVIGSRIDELKRLQRIIDNQLNFIDSYREGSTEIHIKEELEPRSVIYIKKDLDLNKPLDELDVIRDFINSFSYRSIPEEWFFSGSFGCIYSEKTQGLFHFAFFYDGIFKDADLILPQGNYATLLFQGTDTSLFDERLKYIVSQVKKEGWQSDDKICEIWQIDEYHSRKEKDFVTEIQIYIKKT